MPSLLATKVSAATDLLAATINAIIDDIRSRHDHKDGRGYPIDHADLLEGGAMASVDHTHANIQTHMMGTGETFTDNPGGDEGVHGLISGQMLVGTIETSPLIIQVGSGSFGTPVAFPTAFTVLKGIWLQCIGAKTGDDHYPAESYFTDYSTSGFTAEFEGESFDGSGFFWLAIGTMTS